MGNPRTIRIISLRIFRTATFGPPDEAMVHSIRQGNPAGWIGIQHLQNKASEGQLGNEVEDRTAGRIVEFVNLPVWNLGMELVPAAEEAGVVCIRRLGGVPWVAADKEGDTDNRAGPRI